MKGDSPRARRLRRESTAAESLLWTRLKNRQLSGYKFRRQFPIDPYVADFVCLEQKLVIEIDGESHAHQESKDAKRTAWLESHGFTVIRFWNNEVSRNIEGVLVSIETALSKD